MMTALKLSASAALGLAYLAVAWASAHPRVTDEYAAHYLHRTVECWYSRGEAPPPEVIEIGTLSYPEPCRYLRMGWYAAEDWGVWSKVHGSTLRIPPRPGARAVALTLRAAPAPQPVIRVRFSWDGHEAEEDFAPGSTRTVTVPLAPDGTRGAELHILPLGRATVPGIEDPARSVGIGLTTIRYSTELAREGLLGEAQ